MAVNSRSKLADITLADIADEAGRWPLGPSAAVRVAGETAEGLLAAVAEIDVPDRLQALVQERATELLRGDR